MYETLKAIEGNMGTMSNLFNHAPEMGDRIREAIKQAQAEETPQA